MNHPNLKEKFPCYYEKLLLSKTVQLVTFIVKDYSKNQNTHFRGSGWLGSYISGILGEISLKVFLSVLNFYF